LRDVPEGRRAKPAVDINQVGQAFDQLDLEDVRAAEGLTFAANGPHAEVRTFDGLTVTAQWVEQDGQTWVRFAARGVPSAPAAPAAPAAPNAQQIGVTLVGGQLPTPNGTVQVNGLAPVGNAAAGATAFSAAPLTVQTIPPATPVAPNTANTAGAGGNISNSPLPRGISDTPPPPNNPAVAPPAINAPQQPMAVPPNSTPAGPRGFR